MKIKNITYPTALDNGVDKYNDNIDVFVETQNGMNFTLTVCTPLFYTSYMEKEGVDFIPASSPDIIVKELTHDNIYRALESFCEDNGYWLKTFYLLGTTEKICPLEHMDKMIYDISMKLKADVVAQFEFVGFRKNNIYEGYRPSHLILDNNLTTGIHNYYNLQENSSNEIKGTITFVSPEDYPHSLWVGKKIEMYEGSRMVGYATVVEILNPILNKGSGNK